MRRTLEMTAALVLSISCGLSAYAQTSQGVNLSANVNYNCIIKGFSSPPALKMTIPVDAKGTVDTTTQTLSVPWAFCLFPVDVIATSLNTGVRSAVPATPGFTNVIHYQGTATFGKAKSVVTTSTSPVGSVGSTGFLTLSPLNISVQPLAPPQPLVAGDYSDTLRITLTPK